MKRHPFNLIELLLALGVIVIGLVSVMALFPIGASTNRDAMAENYSAQAAEQILNSLAYYMRLSNTNWESAIKVGATGTGKEIPEAKSSAEDQADEIEQQAEYFADGEECKFLDSGTETIFWEESGHCEGGFRIENKSSSSGITDFEGMVALWHEPIVLGGSPRPKISTTLHLEISWPAQIDYARRRKARYSLQVFNPNH